MNCLSSVTFERYLPIVRTASKFSSKGNWLNRTPVREMLCAYDPNALLRVCHDFSFRWGDEWSRFGDSPAHHIEGSDHQVRRFAERRCGSAQGIRSTAPRSLPLQHQDGNGRTIRRAGTETLSRPLTPRRVSRLFYPRRTGKVRPHPREFFQPEESRGLHFVRRPEPRSFLFQVDGQTDDRHTRLHSRPSPATWHAGVLDQW